MSISFRKIQWIVAVAALVLVGALAAGTWFRTDAQVGDQRTRLGLGDEEGVEITEMLPNVPGIEQGIRWAISGKETARSVNCLLRPLQIIINICFLVSSGATGLNNVLVPRRHQALALACLMSATLVAQEANVKQLMSKDLTDLSNKEGVMITVEYPPDASDPIHRHNADQGNNLLKKQAFGLTW